MPKQHKPRAGSLQFWPRKRAAKILPSVNWKPLEEKYKSTSGLLGFIGYKVGMESVIVKDEKQTSLTKGQELFMPVSIIELPPQRILSVRLYKGNKLVGEVFANPKDYKWLKKKIKLSQKEKTKEELIKELEEKLATTKADKLRLLVYTKPKLIGLKKTPDIAEIAIAGSLEQQLNFVKENIDKDLNPSIKESLKANAISLIDVRGVTKGKGFQGPIKRFGIKRKQHKSEKGVRRPGSIGPWNPSRVSFRVPMAGQLGFFTRIEYNKYLLDFGNIKEKNINKKDGFLHYGFIDGDFVMVKGSVMGPAKRPLLLTLPLRPSPQRLKEKYSLIKLNYDVQPQTNK
jgi:large subunit ribosomal protein L3